ncbi:hypothetical protein B566_EDAN013331 [Ephemera danica]|nr:hypothetical protein B566_EDAN013331 [Ephemera danica]
MQTSSTPFLFRPHNPFNAESPDNEVRRRQSPQQTVNTLFPPQQSIVISGTIDAEEPVSDPPFQQQGFRQPQTFQRPQGDKQLFTTFLKIGQVLLESRGHKIVIEPITCMGEVVKAPTAPIATTARPSDLSYSCLEKKPFDRELVLGSGVWINKKEFDKTLRVYADTPRKLLSQILHLLFTQEQLSNMTGKGLRQNKKSTKLKTAINSLVYSTVKDFMEDHVTKMRSKNKQKADGASTGQSSQQTLVPTTVQVPNIESNDGADSSSSESNHPPTKKQKSTQKKRRPRVPDTPENFNFRNFNRYINTVCQNAIRNPTEDAAAKNAATLDVDNTRNGKISNRQKNVDASSQSKQTTSRMNREEESANEVLMNFSLGSDASKGTNNSTSISSASPPSGNEGFSTSSHSMANLLSLTPSSSSFSTQGISSSVFSGFIAGEFPSTSSMPPPPMFGMNIVDPCPMAH